MDLQDQAPRHAFVVETCLKYTGNAIYYVELIL